MSCAPWQDKLVHNWFLDWLRKHEDTSQMYERIKDIFKAYLTPGVLVA